MITEILAIYAAILASLSAVWQGNRWLNDRARIKVEVTFGLPSPIPGEDVAAVIGIRMINHGQRPIQIVGAGLELQEHRNISYMSPPRQMRHLEAHQIPANLEEGTSAEVFFDVMELTRSLAEDNDGNLPTHGWVRDATGREHRVRIPKHVLANWGNEVRRRTGTI